jgi:rod shape determining protein RodA
MRFFRHFDWLIFFLALVIALLGLVLLKSIAPSLVIQQIIWLILGLFFFFIFSQIDYRHYPRFVWLFYFGSIFFLLLTFIFGRVIRGSVRWLEIGSFGLQPSEIVKPFLLLFFAVFFASEEINLNKIFKGFLLLLPPFLMIFFQPDLGSSLLVLFFWLGIVLAKGMKGKWLALTFSFFLLILPLFWFFLKDYQRQRLLTFLNPQIDALGSGFNVIQSMIAVGSGQFLGRGLGRGTQSHLSFLPEHQTDFVFASLAEELGFIGSFLLIGLFFLLLWRILNLARNSHDQLAFLIYIGVFTLLFSQVFVNLGMNLGLLPVTGITLPLVSYGGSSLLSTMIALGIVVGIGKEKEEKRIVEIR